MEEGHVPVSGGPLSDEKIETLIGHYSKGIVPSMDGTLYALRELQRARARIPALEQTIFSYAERMTEKEAALAEQKAYSRRLEARNRELEANAVDADEMNFRHNAKLSEMSDAYVELEARLRRSEARVVELEKGS